VWLPLLLLCWLRMHQMPAPLLLLLPPLWVAMLQLPRQHQQEQLLLLLVLLWLHQPKVSQCQGQDRQQQQLLALLVSWQRLCRCTGREH
jgi:hypothetical protein